MIKTEVSQQQEVQRAPDLRRHKISAMIRSQEKLRVTGAGVIVKKKTNGDHRYSKDKWINEADVRRSERRCINRKDRGYK